MKDKTDNQRGQLIMIDGSKPPKRKGTSRSATLPSGLTEKQEAFCQAVYDGHSFSDAYRASYDCSNSKPASVNRQAHEMILNLKVTSRISDLQRGREEQQRMQALSRSEKVLKKLEQLGFDDSVGDSAQLKALELLGKSVALFTDKVETEDKTERDAALIKAELQTKIDRLLG